LVISSLLVTVVTIAAMLVGLEVALRAWWKDPYMWDRRLMFFSDGRNFRNTAWGGYAYEPGATIDAATYYITNLDPKELVLEYRYQYRTNALGRVQRTELDSVKPSIVFLGDSFTEGQGAVPWFYRLEAGWPRTSPYQLVNGGMLGTGVEDWARLYQDLSRTLNITKAVVIYIGDDWHRPVWQLPAQTLACLRSSGQCVGDENFYGLPADSGAAASQVDRIAQYRIRQLEALRDSTSLVRRTAVYRRLVAPVARRVKGKLLDIRMPEDAMLDQLEISKRDITRLVDRLGRENVLFVYLPQRHELERGPNLYGKKANDFITESGYSLVDGRAQCGLTAKDYHPHDGHPNVNGYAKIEACIARVTKQAFEDPRASAAAVR